MIAIGGYFELDKGLSRNWHDGALGFNSGRNALRYYLREHQVKCLYVPYYTCDSLLNAIRKEGVEIRQYHIDEQFYPLGDMVSGGQTAIVYVNYWGLFQRNVEKLGSEQRHLIIDNSQAFFADAEAMPAFYSPRKFFGVADGGYLVNVNVKAMPTPDNGVFGYTALLMRSVDGPEAGHQAYREAEAQIANLPIAGMSAITESLLSRTDFDMARLLRERNFLFLDRHLSGLNQLSFDLTALTGPMAYPFLPAAKGLRNFLISQRVFVAQYWPELLNNEDLSDWERTLAGGLLPLPIDQRYDLNAMARIVECVMTFCNQYSEQETQEAIA